MAPFISQKEFISFHRIDRQVYKILLINLLREPTESMQIVALWIWWERVGLCNNLVSKILSLPKFLINQVADESITCLNCSSSDIPLLQKMMGKERRLLFLSEKAKEGVAEMLEQVCVRAFADMMQQGMRMRMRMGKSKNYSMVQECNGRSAGKEDRTLFVTFSKGHPVDEWEVREFMRSRYGNSIEGVYMQEVEPNEQALFARIVFHAASTIDFILKGATKAKFTINGKHVWARKFVPKPSTTFLLPPSPSAF